MVYIYSLVVEKPNLTSLNRFSVGERGSGVPIQGVVLHHESGFHFIIPNLSLYHNYSILNKNVGCDTCMCD